MKKYITTIEDKASRIISEYQEKNKALAYELKESKDIQKRQKICEDILQDANDGLMAKNAKQNEQIKSMKNEIGKKHVCLKESFPSKYWLFFKT